MISKVSKLVLMAAFGVIALAANAQTFVSTVTLAAPPNQIAVNALTNRIYVTVPNPTGAGFDYLTVINGKTDTVLTNIKLSNPVGTAVAVDDLRFFAYVAGTYVNAKGDTVNQVAQVSTVTNKVVKYITLSNTADPNNGQINGLAVNLANGDVWVANGSDSEIDVVSDAGKITHRISTASSGEEPTAVAINPITGYAYVTLTQPLAAGTTDAPMLDVISLKTLATTASVTFGAVGSSNQGVTVNDATGYVYVTNSSFSGGVGSVGVFNSTGVQQTYTDPTTGIVYNALVASASPQGIDVDLLTNRIYVANNGDVTISVVNGAAPAASPASISAPLPFSASWLAVNPITSKVYMSSSVNDPSAGNFVTVIHE